MALVFQKLQQYKIPDGLFDDAYNNTDPKIKGFIKKAIALHYQFISQLYRVAGEVCCVYKYQSFQLNKSNKKKKALLYIADESISPVYIISSLLFLKVLGIEHHVVTNFKNPPHQLLLTLELVGEFDVYNLDEALLLDLCSHLKDYTKIFFNKVSGCFNEENLVTLMPPKKALIIRSSKSSKFNIDKNLIFFAHPSVQIDECEFSENLEQSLKDGYTNIQVIYSEVKLPQSSFESIRCNVYGPGLELLWLWPNLKEEFFFKQNFMYWLM